jgi:hypothetical protein
MLAITDGSKDSNRKGFPMLDWTFELNDQPLSALKHGAIAFPAFSGLGSNVNRRVSACLAGKGPIPPGEYYLLDRQTGGRLGSLYNVFSNHEDWFALYANDGTVDDETYCNKVKRGNFRLHPKGPLGISEGCITIDTAEDFQRLRAILKNSKQVPIPGSKLPSYGKVTVK